MAIREMAAEALKYFYKKDVGGYERDIYHLAEDTPLWVQEMVDKAQAGMRSDYLRYRFVVEALNAISTAPKPDAIPPLAADSQPVDLLEWISSHVDRIEYVDDAWIKGLVTSRSDTVGRLSAGQALEKKEVLEIVISCIEDYLDPSKSE